MIVSLTLHVVINSASRVYHYIKISNVRPLCTLAKALLNDRQGHERIQRAGQERDTSGHLPITESKWRKASKWRGSLIHGERLAWVTAQGPRTAVSSAVITKVFQTNYKRGNEFLHGLIKFAMCTGRKNRLRHCNLRTSERCACARRDSHCYYVSVMQTTVSG